MSEKNGSRWIRAKDELPEMDETVLVFNRTLARPNFIGEPPQSGILMGRRTLSNKLRPDGCSGFDETTTHWMRLPAPPEE